MITILNREADEYQFGMDFTHTAATYVEVGFGATHEIVATELDDFAKLVGDLGGIVDGSKEIYSPAEIWDKPYDSTLFKLAGDHFDTAREMGPTIAVKCVNFSYPCSVQLDNIDRILTDASRKIERGFTKFFVCERHNQWSRVIPIADYFTPGTVLSMLKGDDKKYIAHSDDGGIKLMTATELQRGITSKFAEGGGPPQVPTGFDGSYVRKIIHDARQSDKTDLLVCETTDSFTGDNPVLVSVWRNNDTFGGTTVHSFCKNVIDHLRQDYSGMEWGIHYQFSTYTLEELAAKYDADKVSTGVLHNGILDIVREKIGAGSTHFAYTVPAPLYKVNNPELNRANKWDTRVFAQNTQFTWDDLTTASELLSRDHRYDMSTMVYGRDYTFELVTAEMLMAAREEV